MTHQLAQHHYFNSFQNYVCSKCQEQDYQFDLSVVIVDGEAIISFDPCDNGFYCRTCDEVTEMIEEPETKTAQEEADKLNKECGDSTRFNVCYETGYMIDCENDPFFIITRGVASKYLCQEAWEDAKIKRTLQQEGWECDDWEEEEWTFPSEEALMNPYPEKKEIVEKMNEECGDPFRYQVCVISGQVIDTEKEEHYDFMKYDYGCHLLKYHYTPEVAEGLEKAGYTLME
ncbi:MAG: hypothetical protein ACR2M6_04455 [Vampirovibrionia bacterium]